ncbi:unnamed protein product [Adineta steineri]|uniref:G-protein coupled receptors family 1 profile domain-containing protein n=1 Tax=Adineta steineri TaxID=433720 RepID=A0A815XXD9_9BILA|nr:unnamed protein product [Adineta steineri]CAF1562835.1 unnamed protein product [Adineta steineri]
MTKIKTTSIIPWNSTTSMTITSTSLLEIKSSISILIRFEIIAACITYGFGFIGNLLSLFIFSTQSDFRNVSTGVLFLLMTVSNTAHLWTLTTEFLGTFNIYVYSDVFLQCRLNYFIQNVSRAISTYLAITVTCDRLIRSELPIRSRFICTRENAIKLTIFYCIIFSILHSFWFCPLNTLSPIGGVCYTGPPSAYTYFFSNIFLPLRLIFICIIPVIIMSLANIRMLFNIRQSHRRVTQGNEINVIPGGSMRQRMTSLDRMLFYMMLVNVSAFIITQIPFQVYTLVRTYYRGLSTLDNLLVRALVLIWSSIYFGFGSYLYCFASPLFRESLFRILKNIIYCRIHQQRR